MQTRTAADEQPRALLTVNDVCGRLQLSRAVVYDLINSGQLASFKVGRSRRIPTTALLEFIASRLGDGPDAA